MKYMDTPKKNRPVCDRAMRRAFRHFDMEMEIASTYMHSHSKYK